MKQYIDKDKIVAEIEKAIDEPAPSHDQQCPWEDGYYCGLYKVEGIIDNLEVKEVDLESLLHPSKVNNNFFKEVYFGKPYKTRDGRKALYCYKFTDNSHALIIEGEEEFWYVRDDGLVDDFDDSFMDSSYYTDKDIISEW